MANSGGIRSAGASAVGWLIVAIIAFLLFGFAIGTLKFLLRIVAIVVVIGGLLWVYFKLKDDDDD